MNIKVYMQGILSEEDYRGLRNWYHEALTCNCEYVVFVVRRSYLLALIMEEISGKKYQLIESEEKKYITDAALLSNIEEFADYYFTHRRFPTVMLCDDLLLHGRNLNHILDEMSEKLFECISSRDQSITKEEFLWEWLLGVRINVFARAPKHLLLHLKYFSRLKVHIGKSMGGFTNFRRSCHPLSHIRINQMWRMFIQ